MGRKPQSASRGELESNGGFGSESDIDESSSSTSGSESTNAGSTPIIDPAAFTDESGTADSEPAKRGRGRPPKNGGTKSTGSKTKNAKLDLSGLEALLYSVHLMLASAIDTPEIALREDESEQLAKATANVARHYDFGASQKTMDWGQLFIALGIIYVPKVVAINAKNKRSVTIEDENYKVKIDPLAATYSPIN